MGGVGSLGALDPTTRPLKRFPGLFCCLGPVAVAQLVVQRPDFIAQFQVVLDDDPDGRTTGQIALCLLALTGRLLECGFKLVRSPVLEFYTVVPQLWGHYLLTGTRYFFRGNQIAAA